MLAICQIREQPHYRRDAFVSGLKRNGYDIVQGGRPSSPRDLLVIWNRYGATEGLADTWERSGGSVLVCENGYIGQDEHGRQLYAMARHGHNGSGSVPDGGDRLSALSLDVHPWRTDGGYILVCGQRGIGSRSMASPAGWENTAVRRLSAPTRIRRHPGNSPATVSLEDDLVGASACAIWSSACGVKALVMGIPVIYDAPHWVCSEAASRIGEPLVRDDEKRLRALHRMSWSQWTVNEIASGEPFAALT